MAKYKCLSKGYWSFTKGEIYEETILSNKGNNVLSLTKIYPEDWELVEEDTKLTFPREMMCYNDSIAYAQKVKIFAYIENIPRPWIGYGENYRYAEELPVKPQYSLPIINGYKGKLIEPDRDLIEFGCAQISIQLLKRLTLSHNGNRTIKSIKLDSGVEITMEQIKQIIKYIENQ